MYMCVYIYRDSLTNLSLGTAASVVMCVDTIQIRRRVSVLTVRRSPNQYLMRTPIQKKNRMVTSASEVKPGTVT